MWRAPRLAGLSRAQQRQFLCASLGLVAVGQHHFLLPGHFVCMGSSSCKAPPAFGKKSTAKEVVDAFAPNGGLKGRVAIVTGGNSGIGLETVKALAAGGCRVIMTSRDIDVGRRMVEEEVRQNGVGGYAVADADVVVMQLDLADLQSVATFAQKVASSEPRVDYLVLNAGVMALPSLTPTKDGFETQIGVNHFGHALLERILRPKLESQDLKSRIVVLASTAHRMASKLDVGNLHYKDGAGYGAWAAYGASKLANVLFARALAKTLPENVTVTSLHPGVIRTNLWRSTLANSWFGGMLLNTLAADKDIPQGASTTLWACLSDEAAERQNSGKYLSDCTFQKTSTLGSNDELADTLMCATNEQLNAALVKRGLDPFGLPLN